MSRLAIAAISVCLLAGSAYADHNRGQVVSYYSNGASGIVGIVPPGGFVLTDIYGDTQGINFNILINEKLDEIVTTKTSLKVEGDTLAAPKWTIVNYGSGIPFTEGSTIEITPPIGAGRNITLSGYIPQPVSSVPALGSFGMGAMALAFLGVGVSVLRRRKMVV